MRPRTPLLPALLGVALVALGACELVGGIDTKVKGTTSTSGAAAGGMGGAGGAGGADCPRSPEALASDPQNCGACRHDCLGGRCVEGECLPYAFVCGIDPLHLVVDATTVYWTDYAAQKVFAKRKDGSGDVVTLATTPGRPYDLHPDYDTIFFTEYGAPGRVRGIHKDGSLPATYGPGLDNLELLDVEWDAFTVAGSNDGSDSFISRVFKDNSTPNVIRTAPAPTSIGALTSDVNHVYFTDAGQNLVGRILYTGGEVETIDDTSAGPGPLWVWLDDAYWADASGIRRKPKDGSGIVEDLGATPYPASGLGIDATHVYFAAPDGGEADGVVGRMRKDQTDQTPEVLATGADPVALAIDDFAVYAAMRGEGCIVRIAK